MAIISIVIILQPQKYDTNEIEMKYGIKTVELFTLDQLINYVVFCPLHSVSALYL